MLYAAALAVVGLSVSTSAMNVAAKPECVDKCWTNTQYVSLCQGDHQCLCDDSEFQNAVYQCLYSQCSTSKFGTALHYALGACHAQPESHSESVFDITPVDVAGMSPVDDTLKRRGKSVSASRSATKSVTKSATKSVTKSHYPTGSARPVKSVHHSKSVTKSAHHSKSVTKSARPTKSVTKSARPTKSVTKSAKKPTKSVTKSAKPTKSVIKKSKA